MPPEPAPTRRRPRSSVTSLADVAQLAQVSLATASRVLNPDATHPVNEATRGRVRKAAEELGYHPNLMARSLRSSRLPMLAVIVHDITDPYFAEIVRGASEEAQAQGYLTFVCSSQRDAEVELRYVEMLRLSRVSAVLFAAGGLDAPNYASRVGAVLREITAYGGAVVALAPRAERWPTEVCDNPEGTRLATQHLVSLGHRHIAFIAGPTTVHTSIEREEGYQQAMAAAGVPPLVERADFTMRGGGAAVGRLLDHHPEMTAVAVASDTMALGVLAELRRRRVRVPEDLSVTGFGDIPVWEQEHPALTTAHVGLAEIGAAGARRALQRLRGQDTARRVQIHPVRLVVRDSTAAPRPNVHHSS